MNSSIEPLVKALKRLHRLGAVSDLLEWDEQVNLPSESSRFRGEQLAHLSELLHREETSPQFEMMLSEVERSPDISSFTEQELLIVREARKDFDREKKLPSEFAARKAEAQSRAYHGWVKAREASDFSAFAPLLAEQVDLAKEEANYQGFEGADAYDYWIDHFDPGMNAASISPLFSDLVAELAPLVQAITESPVKARPELLKGFPVEAQESFLRKVVARLGFDFERGRLDRSVHPFCAGCGLDTRMTTRFFEDNPLDSLFSSIHETGHGLYEQGLPSEHIGTALGTAAGMAAHESQSRLWENQVARSRAFWKFWEPEYRKAFPQQLSGISSEDLYLAVNAVSAIPVRVDSDEVTYNLHIVIRFEIEQGLFNGDVDVKDIPDVWASLYQKYLGLTPENHKEGCLQDVHWSGGAFGYFPSYCLGNMLAAQMFESVQAQIPDLDSQIAEGQFKPLLEWLRKAVHSRGMQVNALSLAREVSGNDLSARPLISYLKNRYGSLYQCV